MLLSLSFPCFFKLIRWNVCRSRIQKCKKRTGFAGRWAPAELHSAGDKEAEKKEGKEEKTSSPTAAATGLILFESLGLPEPEKLELVTTYNGVRRSKRKFEPVVRVASSKANPHLFFFPAGTRCVSEIPDFDDQGARVLRARRVCH